MDAERLPADQEQLVGELLRTALGSSAELRGYQIVGQRPDYWVIQAAVGLGGEQVVVKLAGPAAPFSHSFGRLAAVHRLVAERTDVPIAAVLAFADDTATWPWRYLIQRHVAGRQLAEVRPELDAAGLHAVMQQIGAAVAALHGLSFPTWGAIGAEGGVAAGTADPVAALAERARALIPGPRLLEAFLAALDTRHGAFADVAAPALCHDDLHHYNILVARRHDSYELAAILDFDKSWAGLAESDLARMELWGMTGTGFWPGYRARQAAAPGYTERRPLLQLLWCLEYAVPSPQHTADTARICAELGIPPIRFE